MEGVKMALSQELENVQKTIIFTHRELFYESPTPMKLQKLCYYAQGYALAQGKVLFSEDFQAWQHGPVIFELYIKYKHFQWGQITDNVDNIDQLNYPFIRSVVSAYGRYDGAALSTMTHRETPWMSVRGNLDETEGSNALITKDSIRSFFISKLNAHG